MHRILLNLLVTYFLIAPLYAKVYTPPWGTLTTEDSGDVALFLLDNWQIEFPGSVSKGELPFYTEDKDSLSFSNTFNLAVDSIRNDYVFKSNGFNGVFRVIINDHLIASGPNGTFPLSVLVPKEYLMAGNNSIKIILAKSRNIINSFPTYTRLYSEPEYLGISRKFYLQVHSQLFDRFDYRIDELNTTIQVNYKYLLNKKFISEHSKQDGLSFTEVIRNQNNREVNRRSLTYTSTTSSIVGAFNINPENLWSPQNPVHLTITLSLNRFGQSLFSQTRQIAFRNISINNKTIFINENAGQIRGINYYENLRFKQYNGLYTNQEQHLRIIKDMGFNAVRFINHIPDLNYLTIADSLGLLIFLDMPLKRYPESIFTQDKFLENTKETINHSLEVLASHPSFTALGIGNEVLISEAPLQKFFFILNNSIERPFPFLTYLSPVPEINISVDKAADFYILDAYYPVKENEDFIKESAVPYSLAGKAAFTKNDKYLNIHDPNYNLNKRILIVNEINSITQELGLQGGFIESFIDWQSETVSHQAGIGNNIVNSGLLDSTNTQYSWVNDIEKNLWEPSNVDHLDSGKKDKSTNIFSILLFFISLFFFFFYRRYPRLSENYMRSIKHPYGFYVDLRERRIIPVFNSFVTGVHNSMISSIFVGSFIYFYNDSILLTEFLRTIFPFSLFNFIINIFQSVWYLILVGFLLFAFYPVYIGIIVKIYSIFTRRTVRARQALAVGLWSGSPLIFFLPVSIIAYHLLVKGGFDHFLFAIFTFFLFWIQLRLINGIRVLLLAKFQSIFLLLLLSYSVPVVIFLLLFDHQPLWTEYLITLVKSHTLF
jgi:hypothetical protein